MDTIRERLREELEKHGAHSDAEQARFLGESGQNYFKIMKGTNGKKTNINEKHISKFAEKLNIAPYQLFLSSEEAKKLQEEKGKMREYQEMIDLMELVPFFRNQLMAKFEELKENHPEKIREAEKKGLSSSMSK